ncbi:hypothetical protein CER19_25650 [Pseudomonas sp. GL93]|uniref:hypothetical protein n=1 Tax=Pseudomonas sp. GL93 TaxID=2014741 RepID=UPI000E318242|nr:hypothetical protein [Pseudomonas sp. GL93]RFD24414.1 hypothetical protein CER19_25650 [Pseudomonas sp. GL93]
MTSAAANTPSTNAKRLDERSALFTELYVGPSFRETAPHLLRQSLREHYPTQDIDPDIAMVGTPTWQLIGDEIIATFHEKPAGVWVQRENPVETPPTTTLDLATCVNQAQDLLDELQAFKQRATEQVANAQRSAIGIEWLYHQHAQKLEQARGADADTLDGLSEKQKTSIYLSEINLKQAQRLFFNVK